jgi:beta-aspartyl-peptidase (threonine type)
MEYKSWSVEKAANKVIHDKLTGLGGTGGIIALDHNGRIAMPFNTPGMYRAWMKGDGVAHVSMFKNEGE